MDTKEIKIKVMDLTQPSLNGRQYNIEDIREIINSEGFPKYGELGQDTITTDSLTVKADNVSHEIGDSWIDDDGIWWATITFTDTPSGKIAKDLVNSGASLQVSPRGLGKLNGNREVMDYELIALDLVNDGNEH